MMRLRLLNWTRRATRGYAEVSFEPRDCWFGVYWRLHRCRAEITGWDHRHGDYIASPWAFGAHLCLLPMLPLHVAFTRTVRP